MVAVEPTIELEAYIADIADRAKKLQARLVDPTEDNTLKIPTDGRKAAVDMRLVDPDLDVMIGETKISATADLLAKVSWENKDRIYDDPGTKEPPHTGRPADRVLRPRDAVGQLERVWAAAR